MVANYLVINAIEPLINHDDELYKLFDIVNLWDFIHSLDEVIVNFLTRFNVYVIERAPGVSSSSGISRIVKAYPNLHRGYADIPREDIMGCRQLQLAINEVEASLAGVITHSVPAAVQSISMALAAGVVPMATETQTAQADAMSAKSPTPDDTEVSVAMASSRIAADIAAADVFLVLSDAGLQKTDTPVLPIFVAEKAAKVTEGLSDDDEAIKQLEDALEKRRRAEDTSVSSQTSSMLLTPHPLILMMTLIGIFSLSVSHSLLLLSLSILLFILM